MSVVAAERVCVRCTQWCCMSVCDCAAKKSASSFKWLLQAAAAATLGALQACQLSPQQPPLPLAPSHTLHSQALHTHALPPHAPSLDSATGICSHSHTLAAHTCVHHHTLAVFCHTQRSLHISNPQTPTAHCVCSLSQLYRCTNSCSVILICVVQKVNPLWFTCLYHLCSRVTLHACSVFHCVAHCSVTVLVHSDSALVCRYTRLQLLLLFLTSQLCV